MTIWPFSRLKHRRALAAENPFDLAEACGAYAPLVEKSLAASRARFYSWEFSEGTMALDPQTATREEIVAALLDCTRCCAIEYPETEEGYGRASRRRDELEEAIKRRWPQEAAAILDARLRAGVRAAVSAHGGPLPDWAREP